MFSEHIPVPKRRVQIFIFLSELYVSMVEIPGKFGPLIFLTNKSRDINMEIGVSWSHFHASIQDIQTNVVARNFSSSVKTCSLYNLSSVKFLAANIFGT